MDKKKRTPLILLIVILVLLVAAYFGMIVWNDSQEKKKEAEEDAGKIYVTDLSEMSKISFDVGNGEITLEKDGDTWYNALDKEFSLAQTYPEQMVKTFGKLEADRKLENGDSLEAYGLEDPVYTVVLTDADGTETTLYFGNVTGDDYYLTLNDKEEIYTVSTNVISDLQYTLEDMEQSE